MIPNFSCGGSRPGRPPGPQHPGQGPGQGRHRPPPPPAAPRGPYTGLLLLLLLGRPTNREFWMMQGHWHCQVPFDVLGQVPHDELQGLLVAVAEVLPVPLEDGGGGQDDLLPAAGEPTGRVHAAAAALLHLDVPGAFRIGSGGTGDAEALRGARGGGTSSSSQEEEEEEEEEAALPGGLTATAPGGGTATRTPLEASGEPSNQKSSLEPWPVTGRHNPASAR